MCTPVIVLRPTFVFISNIGHLFFLIQKVVKRPGKLSAGKGGKKKKTTLRFTVDCTHPVEDGIMDVTNFVSSCTIKISSYFRPGEFIS